MGGGKGRKDSPFPAQPDMNTAFVSGMPGSEASSTTSSLSRGTSYSPPRFEATRSDAASNGTTQALPSGITYVVPPPGFISSPVEYTPPYVRVLPRPPPPTNVVVPMPHGAGAGAPYGIMGEPPLEFYGPPNTYIHFERPTFRIRNANIYLGQGQAPLYAKGQQMFGYPSPNNNGNGKPQ